MRKLILLFIAGFIAASCASTKHVTYFQDIPINDTTWQNQQGATVKIQSGDAISIVVNTQDPLLDAQFNLAYIQRYLGMTETSYSGSSQGISRYTVNQEGNILFPVLGDIHVLGLTRQEIQDKIREELINANLVKDPVITVEFMNLYVSVLGDVVKPGRYTIDRDQITILDAISKAGDLNITGNRINVLVLRTEIDNTQKAYRVDLCNASKLYKSPVFYLQQNDIIYVEPNQKKVRDSTVNGNNILSTAFWISVVSVVLSAVTTIVAVSK